MLGYGVSDRQGHVTALFRMNGYEVSHGEIMMDWRDFRVSEPEMPDKKLRIEVEEKSGRGVRNNVEVRVMLENNQVLGACESISLGHRLGVDALQDMGFVHWLWVRDEHQHQGWGRYLVDGGLIGKCSVWDIGIRQSAPRPTTIAPCSFIPIMGIVWWTCGMSTVNHWKGR